MTTRNQRFFRQKIQRFGVGHTLMRSLTRPARITNVTSHPLDSSQTAFITRATFGIVCVHRHASLFSDFTMRLFGIQRFLSWPTTTHETGFPAHHSGPIGHTRLRVFTRRRCWSPLILCPRTSMYLTRRLRGLLCSHTRTTARDGFAVQSGLRPERPTRRCRQQPLRDQFCESLVL